MPLLSLTLTLSIVSLQVDASRPPAPAPSCLDARAVTEVRTLNDNQLLIRAGGKRFRLETGDVCPGRDGGTALLAEHGWVCGGAREFVRTSSHLCPIARVEPLPARDYARLLREADATLLANSGGTLLKPVESRARRGALKGFRGSPDYCLAISDVRSWSADKDDIVVKVRRRPPAGHERYRITFHGGCTEAGFLPVLTLRSGAGNDLLCGNAGDVAVLSRDNSACDLGGDFICPNARFGADATTAAFRGCQVAEVYPIDP